NFFLRMFQPANASALSHQRINPRSQTHDQQPEENGWPHEVVASLLPRCRLMQVLFKIIENVFEPGNIFWRCFAQSFMRFQHRFGLFSFLSVGAVEHVLLHLLACRSGRTVRPDLENLIEPKPGKKLATAIAAMNNMKMTLAQC